MKPKPAPPSGPTHKKRVRELSRLFREFAVKPESPAAILASHDGAWFQSPHWRALVDECMRALLAGNPRRLRLDLDTSPAVLADPVVQAMLQQLWHLKFLKGPDGTFARKVLKALFDGLWDSHGAPEYPTGTIRATKKREAVKRAKKALRERRKPKPLP